MWTHWENIAHLAQNLVIGKVNTKFIICFIYWLMTVVNSESGYNPGNLVQKVNLRKVYSNKAIIQNT